MAVSGSKNFSTTRSDIISGALRKIGEYDAGETVPGDETTDASFALHLMVKEWVDRGIDIWLRDEITLFLQPNQQSYALGTANATASYVETTLSADEANGQTVISVTSATGFATSDNIGIKIDDDTIHWTTISSISVNDITIASAIDGAAGSGNKVYGYTTTAGRPQKILYAYRRVVNDIDTEVTLIGEKEYMSQSNKSSDGPPV